MRKSFALLLFVAATASAQPVITSVTPSSGKVTGETVTIKGSGFVSTADVRFGSSPARTVRLLDTATLQVTPPPLLPGIYDVSVSQGNQRGFLGAAYTVTGDASEVFDTILVPIYTPTTRGAFGAVFQSTV